MNLRVWSVPARTIDFFGQAAFGKKLVRLGLVAAFVYFVGKVRIAPLFERIPFEVVLEFELGTLDCVAFDVFIETELLMLRLNSAVVQFLKILNSIIIPVQSGILNHGRTCTRGVELVRRHAGARGNGGVIHVMVPCETRVWLRGVR